MAIFRLSKLVRDKIPQLMNQGKQVATVHTLHGKELQKALLLKLKEEADEALIALDNDDEFIGEMADIKEVFDSILEKKNIDKSALIEAQGRKSEAKGGFVDGFFVDTITTEEDTWVSYYRKRPLQYHELYTADTDPAQQFSVPQLQTGLYRHYKGNYYEVIGVGCHTETHEYFVVYRALYEKEMNPRVWIRTYAMFTETVEISGKTVPRFEKVDND